MKERKLVYSKPFQAVDEDNVPYMMVQSGSTYTLFNAFDKLLKSNGLELLVGDIGDDNIWVQIVDRVDPVEVVNAVYGVANGVIHMSKFTDTDYQGFAGAGEKACVGYFEFQSDGNSMWNMFESQWVVVADETGVGVYCTNDNGDDVCLNATMSDLSVTKSLEFVAKEMDARMTPGDLLKIGFKTEYYNLADLND